MKSSPRSFNEAALAKQEDLIDKLNPMIRGWTNYHKNQVAKKIFLTVDSKIWEKLWKWACKRHPSKSKRWIKERYFQSINMRNWVFGCRDKEKKIYHRLIKAADTKIERHVKIKSDLNPFDLKWEPYLEKRMETHMRNDLKGKKKLLRVFIRQEGICPKCGEFITRDTVNDLHHVKPKAAGGDNRISNLVFLHQTCHKQIHAMKDPELLAL